MKKLSHRDLAVLAISLFIGMAFGWAVCAIKNSLKAPITIENPINTALIKHSDSLEAVIVFRDSLIAENERKQAVHDSIIIKNNKVLKNDYEKIKNLDADSRANWIDSVLKKSGIRK